jgi:hypothetical protein
MGKINGKYGKFVITPALMMGMDDTIIDRIAFGGVKELEESIRKSDFRSSSHRIADRIRLENDRLIGYTQTILVCGWIGYHPQEKEQCQQSRD